MGQFEIKAAALDAAKSKFKGNSGLARVISDGGRAGPLTSQAVSQWKQVPVERVSDVELVTGVSRNLLRPDVFGMPDADAIASLFNDLPKPATASIPGPSVYFARAGQDGPIKIGFTAGEPTQRIAGLQTGCPWPIFLIGSLPGSTQNEGDLHRRFAHLRIEGEWFQPEPELLSAIAEMIAPGYFWPEKIGLPADPGRGIRELRENPTIEDIIWAAGGAISIAAASDGEIAPDAVYKWRQNGIRDWHWELMMKLTAVTLQQLFDANRAAKAGTTTKLRVVA